MHRQDCINGFEFNDQSIINDQIQPVTKVKFDSLIVNRKGDLTSERKLCSIKFPTQAFFISRFE